MSPDTLSGYLSGSCPDVRTGHRTPPKGGLSVRLSGRPVQFSRCSTTRAVDPYAGCESRSDSPSNRLSPPAMRGQRNHSGRR